MLAAWLAMTTASTLKDIGEAGARIGIKDAQGNVRTGGDRRIVFTRMCSPAREGARAPARPKQLLGTGRLSVRGRGFSLSGIDDGPARGESIRTGSSRHDWRDGLRIERNFSAVGGY